MHIGQIYRARSVKRWGIIDTTVTQNVAEHTFLVTMIARDMCSRYGIDDVKVMKAAMEHDLDEVLTGDIPSPAKRHMGIRGLDRSKHSVDLSDEEAAILKMADLMESWWFLYNYGAGKFANKQAGLLESRMINFVDMVDREHPGLRKVFHSTMYDLRNVNYD